MKKLNAIKKIVSVALSLTILASAAHAYPMCVNREAKAKTSAEIQAEREANKQKIAEYEVQLQGLKGNKEEAQRYQETLQKQIQLYKNNIESLNAEIENIGSEIAGAEAEIKAIDDSIVQMQKDIDDGVEKFKKRLYSMYVSTDNNLAGVILGSTSFYDMVANKEMLNRIADYDEKLINGILDDIKNIEESRKEMELAKRNLEMKKIEQENRKKEKQSELDSYSEKMSETQAEIDRIKLEEDLLNSKISDLESANKELDAEDARIQAEILRQQQLAQQRYEEEQKKLLQNQTGGGDPVIIPPPSGGGFMWPTPGFWMITSGFGYRWGRLHGGIDIGDGGIHNGRIVASKSGTVVAVSNSCPHDYPKDYSCGCGGGYGNYVTISHDGTYSTLYGHMRQACVSVGEYVQQGQVIGYVGCTGFSTGSHLHFEVYVNGSRQNPLNYVSP